MKKSELKKQIEEVITEILGEGETEERAAKEAEKKSIDAQIKALTMKKAEVNKSGVVAETEDEEFDTPEKEPSKAELKKIDKEFNSSKFAKKLSAEEKERLDKLEAGIKKKLANPTKDNIAIVKQLISRADVKKLFKDGGKDLKALVSDIIG